MVWPEMVGRRRGEGEEEEEKKKEKNQVCVRSGRREEEEKKERKNQGVRGYFDLILVWVFFLKMLGVNS
jgi:hypothetical protein